MTETRKESGGCRCGAIRFEAFGEPRNCWYCHCADCRGYSGAPVMVWVGYENSQIRFTKGKPKVYESSPGIKWGFCPDCGSRLLWEANLSRYGLEDFLLTELTISSFDAPEGFAPDRHWNDTGRIPWFDVHDELPRYDVFSVDEREPSHYGPSIRLAKLSAKHDRS
jgi:hypothetical protein